ncbi:MAG: hypothetical protein O7F76_09340 [Planctomycetota bacterium]|nr:hypothetical protein [Planctomycetota bacterium]MCZ6699794.1 hypothetical protein [Planctomycetota bacterium]MCZ6816879.1 hypothetical protein [Planctomycetota bacterium]
MLAISSADIRPKLMFRGFTWTACQTSPVILTDVGPLPGMLVKMRIFLVTVLLSDLVLILIGIFPDSPG